MAYSSLLEVAFASHRAGALSRAEALYRQVLHADPDNLNALQLLGALVADDGRTTEAVMLLERALATLQTDHGETPQHAILHYNLGNALKAIGRRSDAMAHYRRGVALDPEMAELHASLAAEDLAQGDFAAADRGFTAALRASPRRADWLHNLATTRAAMGRLGDAVSFYRGALSWAPEQACTLRALGLALLSLDRPEEAIAPLTRLAAINPDDPVSHYDLGRAQFACRNLAAARQDFGRAQALRPTDADTHTMIGHVESAAGRVDEAEMAYRRALSCDPDQADALFRLGLLLQDGARRQEAIILFERLLAIAPDHVEVHAALGNACRGLMQPDRALDAFRRYLALAPDSAAAHFHVGRTLAECGRNSEATGYLERAISLDHAGTLTHLAHLLLGNARQRLGQVAEALDAFRHALALEQIAPLRSGERPDFTVLLLLAPGLYNTPYDYLVRHERYDANFVLLVPDFDYDAALLRSRGDVIVNLVSDADHDRAILGIAAALIDRLDRPVINHPDKIRLTDRAAIAALLSGIPGCRVARVTCHGGAELLRPGFFDRADVPAPPFLVRRAGLHNGHAFVKVATEAALQEFAGRHPAADHFVIEYLDYQSADGLFRKYRFFFVGDEILPYHLAIGSGWKVHHVDTDMARQETLKREEEAFLRAPGDIFGPAQMATLRAIGNAVGLEFFGIDCAIDCHGNVVVFEANATMLVHQDNPDFPYKNEYARRIKVAFDRMLRGLA